MASADTSAILSGVNALAKQPSPLSQFGQFANALTDATKAKQSALGFQAQQTVGQAYANNLNSDGTVNTAGVNSDLASTPAGSYALPAQVTQGQVQQANQYGLNSDQLGQVTARTNTFNAALAPLLRFGDNVNRQQVFNQIAGVSASGAPVSEFASDAATTMPDSDGAPLRNWLLNHVGRALPAATDVQMSTPNPTLQNRGGTGVVVDTNPITNPGVTQGDADYRTTLSPEGQVAPQQGPPNAQGGPTHITTAAFANNQGLGGLVPGGPSAFGTGRPLPPALLNPNRSGVSDGPSSGTSASAPMGGSPTPVGGADSGSAPTPQLDAAMAQIRNGGGAAPSGGSSAGGSPVAAPSAPAPMTVGLGPGQSAGLTTAGTASSAQWADLQRQVGGTAAGGGSAGRIYQLQSAVKDLSSLGPNGTGGNTGTWNSIKSYFNTIPGVSSVIGFDPSTIANYDMANKALTNYAAARAGSHGGSTDSQLATTLSSNASTHISNLAATQVAQAAIGLERMDQAQAQAFQNAKDPTTGQAMGTDQFANFSANWNRQMDPRAFIVDQLAPQDVTKLVSGMSPSEQQRFQSTFNSAVANGWVDKPSWMKPSAPPAAAPVVPTGAMSSGN